MDSFRDTQSATLHVPVSFSSAGGANTGPTQPSSPPAAPFSSPYEALASSALASAMGSLSHSRAQGSDAPNSTNLLSTSPDHHEERYKMCGPFSAYKNHKN